MFSIANKYKVNLFVCQHFFRGGARCNRARRENELALIAIRSCYVLFMHVFEAMRASARGLRTSMVKMRPGRRGFRTTPRALAKFGRPKNACVFEGGRIWLSPRKRAVAAATAHFLPVYRSIDFDAHQCF